MKRLINAAAIGFASHILLLLYMVHLKIALIV